MSLSFVDRGESTELVLSQGAFATEPRRALHEADKLEELLSSEAAPAR